MHAYYSVDSTQFWFARTTTTMTSRVYSFRPANMNINGRGEGYLLPFSSGNRTGGGGSVDLVVWTRVISSLTLVLEQLYPSPFPSIPSHSSSYFRENVWIFEWIVFDWFNRSFEGISRNMEIFLNKDIKYYCIEYRFYRKFFKFYS